MQDQIINDLGLKPDDKEVVVLYDGEKKNQPAEFWNGKRVVEMVKHRPLWFSKNLLQKTTQQAATTKEVKTSDLGWTVTKAVLNRMFRLKVIWIELEINLRKLWFDLFCSIWCHVSEEVEYCAETWITHRYSIENRLADLAETKIVVDSVFYSSNMAKNTIAKAKAVRIRSSWGVHRRSFGFNRVGRECCWQFSSYSQQLRFCQLHLDLPKTKKWSVDSWNSR